MKKINLYELLGLLKNKNAPRKILIHDTVYYLLKDEENYLYSKNSHNIRRAWEIMDCSINVTRCLNDEVLILEEDEEVDNG